MVVTESAIPARPRRLARAALVVMFFFVASRVLGLARDIAISHQFGTTRALDMYFAAFSVPDLIFNVLAGGALGSAFIPTFSGALALGDEKRAWRLASSIINLVLIVLTTCAIVLGIFALPVAAATVARGFSPDEQEMTATLMRWMLITPVVFGLSGVVMCTLNSYQHFALPALAPVVYNLAIIAGAIFLSPSIGVYGLVAGVVAGAILHLTIQLPFVFRKRLEIGDWRAVTIQSPASSLQSPDVREVGRLMLPRMIGLGVVQINFLVNTILASSLPAGRIAALAYAWRVMLLPVGVVGQSLATAVFPTLSEQTARRDSGNFLETFSTAFRASLYLSIPAAVGLYILGSPLITLIFQRGEFDSRSTAETAWALQFFAIGLFAHSGLEIVTRAFYAMHDTQTPVAVGVAAMLLNIALSISLLKPLAQGGLALANSVATILEMFALLFILRARVGGMDDRRMMGSAARIVVATMVMVATIAFITNYFSSIGSIQIAILGTIAGALVYVGATVLLRSEEIGIVTGGLHRRIRNRQSAI